MHSSMCSHLDCRAPSSATSVLSSWQLPHGSDLLALYLSVLPVVLFFEPSYIHLLPSGGSKAGCSIIAWNSLVPLKQFVSGRWPLAAFVVYVNSVGHLRYTFISPTVQSICLKNLAHNLLFYNHSFLCTL